MDVTAGFRASNRSRNQLDGSSNDSLKWQYRGKEKPGGIFHLQKLGMFLRAQQEPAELWTNGCYDWIKKVRKAQKLSQKEF